MLRVVYYETDDPNVLVVVQEENTISVANFQRAVQAAGFALKGQRFNAGGDTDLDS